MKRTVEDFKQLLIKIGCDERLLKNPSFGDLPVLSGAINSFINDEKNINIKEENDKIILEDLQNNCQYLVWNFAGQITASYRNLNNENLSYYSYIRIDSNENIKVEEFYSSDEKLVHNFNRNGLEVEFYYESRTMPGLLIAGIRREPNGYVGQIWSSKLNETKTRKVEQVIGYVNLDLRYNFLRFGSGQTPEFYEEVYKALSMSRVNYILPEQAQQHIEKICGISWHPDAKKELLDRMTHRNGFTMNEKYNKDNEEYYLKPERESIGRKI